MENKYSSFLKYCLTTIVIRIWDYFVKSISSSSSNKPVKNDSDVQSIKEKCKDFSQSFLFPSEIISILQMKFHGYMKNLSKIDLDNPLNDIDFCYAILNKVSRSFAVVIEQLPEELKDSVCIFYLVLRALDSIEDDMMYSHEKKIILLRSFHQKLLIDNWSISNVGDKKDYQILLKNFNKVINVFKSLDLKYQKIIIDITQRMGNGMADYIQLNQSIETINSYNLYCHYVAGLVGYGLSSLFVQSGLEDQHLDLDHQLSNSMGLFLQKTNIIRDYFEDLQAGRIWWPKQIWTNYAFDIDDFRKNPNDEQSIECLNYMVMDSLTHLSDVINYLSQLKNPKIFQFCAIPQVMAIATLAELYNNPLVFTSIIKIRKGLTCKLILNCSNLDQVHHWLNFFLDRIENKIPASINQTTKHMHQLVNQLKKSCNQ